ncbi:MAG: CvpA family protein [Pseudomonadota bacterium]
MQFTMVDGGVAAIALVSGYLAYARGLTREMFAIGSWILAAFAAFAFAPLLEPLVREIPVVGDFLATSCVISMVVSFAIIMAVVLLILSVFTPLFSSAVQESALGPIDRALGFLFGLARAALLIAIAYLIYTQFVLGEEQEMWPDLANAASHQGIQEMSRMLSDLLPDQSSLGAETDPATGRPGGIAGWFGSQIDALMAPCNADVPAAPSDTGTGDTGTGNTGGATGTQTAPQPSGN